MKKIILSLFLLCVMTSHCLAMTIDAVGEVRNEEELKVLKACEFYNDNVSCISRLHTDTEDRYYYFRIKGGNSNGFVIVKQNSDSSFTKIISSADLERDEGCLAGMVGIEYGAPHYYNQCVVKTSYYKSIADRSRYGRNIILSFNKKNKLEVKLGKEIRIIDRFGRVPVMLHKPVIYLYPTQTTDITVNLELDGELTCTYPPINDGWQVTAEPDGALTDKRGRKYNYLFWESKSYSGADYAEGFCVAGKDTLKFLEEALDKLGLSEQEADDFITYWLPKMENNPYNIISFQGKNYTDRAVLKVTPKPDTVIRVFMAWKPSDKRVEIPAQKLERVQRKGFTLVEWGGAFE